MPFDAFSQVFNEGLLPCIRQYIDFLLGDGKILGVGVIFLPLLCKLIRLFKKIF